MSDSLDFDATLQKLAAGAVVFDRYLLKRLIGKGRSGDVWEATDQRLEHSIVLKLLVNYPHYDRLLAGAGRFTNLTHPNIVRIFDFIGDRQLSALVMEHVQGQSVAALLREKQPPFFEAADVQPWVRDLFAALDHAWKNGRLVHGDIRPANLLITKSGLLKVAEFPFAVVREGLAVISNHESETENGNLSLPCLSPQVISGEPALHSDDIYSAGACIFEMLTGKAVFPGGNIMTQIQRKVPPSITERRVELERKGAALPKALEALTAKCLNKEREERPASAAEVVSLVQQASIHSTQGRLTTATRALIPSGDWLHVMRQPWMKVAALVFLLAGAFYFTVIRPGSAEVHRRKMEYDKIVAVDALGDAVPENQVKEWQGFLNKYYIKDVMFTDEDDRLNELASASLAKWKTADEEARKVKRAEARDLAEKEDALKDAISELTKKPLPTNPDLSSLTSRQEEWNALLTEHGGDSSPKTPEFKQMIEEASRTRDKVQALLTAAQKAESERLELEKTMAAVVVSWVKQMRGSLDLVKASCADPTKTPVEKLAAVDGYLQKLKVPPPAKAEQDAATLKSEAESLRKEWASSVAALTPTKDLKLPELFVNSVYEHEQLKLAAFGSPAEKNADAMVPLIQAAILKLAQTKIFAEPGINFQGQSGAKPDGAPGPTTHRAIIAYQSFQGKNLVPNGQLDTATLTALSLNQLDVDEMAGKAKESPVEKPQAKKESSGGSTKKSTRGPPPKSIYDQPGGKALEVLHKLGKKINQAEWSKHLKYLRYCEQNNL
jgi:serine/threonine protein kinase/peptidoglycan hydrolase-like protein with peptidoglycan-binding domain